MIIFKFNLFCITILGKERVFFTLAEAIQTKVFCVPDKRKIIRQLENPKFNTYLSDTEGPARIHVLPMRNLHNIVRLFQKLYLLYS